MITNSNKNKKNRIGRLMILPFLSLMICLFSFKMKTITMFHAEKNIKVVIDAGHGGIFPGARINGINEKDINLAISKKIQSLSAEYNVDVIMSRETDITPGSNKLGESLEYIAALPKNKNADLFISIHMNQTADKKNEEMQTQKSGFQIWIPRNNSGVYQGSVKLGSVLTEVIKTDFLIEPELKQTPTPDGNILILKKATVPAALIECGYMDNPGDMKYLLDEKNQEKIARDILEGIKKYNLTAPGQTTTENLHINKNASENEAQETTITNEVELNENVPDSTGPQRKVEVEADYQGGFEGWKSYLFKNLNYPQAAVSNEVQGEVIVEFVVNTDGSLSDIHAISGPKELRAESVRVVRESGHWVPAIDKGMKVASYKKQPIVYKLEVK